MDSQQMYYGPGPGTGQMPVRDKGRTMAVAALVCGIIAMAAFFTFTVFPAAIFGTLAVLFALLSRGSKNRPERNAGIGMTLGIIALCLNLVTTGYAMYRFFTDPVFYAQVNDSFRSLYGENIEEFIQDMQDGSFDGPAGGNGIPAVPGGGDI